MRRWWTPATPWASSTSGCSSGWRRVTPTIRSAATSMPRWERSPRPARPSRAGRCSGRSTRSTAAASSGSGSAPTSPGQTRSWPTPGCPSRPGTPPRQYPTRPGDNPAISTYRDSAGVLGKIDYGESDRIYTLLTREHGKVGVLARGVRRSTSRLASALELFSLVDVQLAKGRNLDVVVQAVRLPGPRVEADVERTAHAGLIAELADRVSEERHPLEGIYELTVVE